MHVISLSDVCVCLCVAFLVFRFHAAPDHDGFLFEKVINQLKCRSVLCSVFRKEKILLYIHPVGSQCLYIALHANLKRNHVKRRFASAEKQYLYLAWWVVHSSYYQLSNTAETAVACHSKPLRKRPWVYALYADRCNNVHLSWRKNCSNYIVLPWCYSLAKVRAISQTNAIQIKVRHAFYLHSLRKLSNKQIQRRITMTKSSASFHHIIVQLYTHPLKSDNNN